jgi:hypothetical protein
VHNILESGPVACYKYLIMHLPTVHGSLSQSSYYIYTACDTDYFDSFGQILIRSVQANTDLGIHVHLFNPRDDQIEFCHKKSVGVTYETVSADAFVAAAQRWNSHALSDQEKIQLDRTLTAMRKGHDHSILERMQKTYYACARFVRLAELFDQSVPVLAIDVDAVVRSHPPLMPGFQDFYIHKITGRKARILAGGISLNPTTGSGKFLNNYSAQIKKYLATDYIYWGLDQDILDQVVPGHNHGQLPMEYIDWNMQPGSCIWTAKGTRKELLSFVNESARYKSG